MNNGPFMSRPQITHSLLGAVALPTAAAMLLLSVLVGCVLHLSTSRSDQLAAVQQEKLIRLAVAPGVESIAKDHEPSTFWDDAVTRVHQHPLDLQWIENNLGVWFYTYYRHDETYSAR